MVRLLIVLLVIIVALAAVAFWGVRALPHVTAAEIGRMTNSRVEIGAFDFHLDGSVSIDGLVIRPIREESRYDNTILRAENVQAQLSRRSLLRLSPRATDIRIEDFTLDVQFDLDTGWWNVQALRVSSPRRGGGGSMPTIRLEQGKVRYCKVSGGDVEVVSSIPVEATFGLNMEIYPGYSFDIKTAKISHGYGESHLKGYWLPGEFALAGGLSSADIPSLERAWAVDRLAGQLRYDRAGKYTLDLVMKDLHGKQTPEVGMFGRIAQTGSGESDPLAGLQRFFDRYRPTGTVGEIRLKATGNFKNLPDSQVMGTLACKDVSICDSKFPYAIDRLSGTMEFTESGVFVNRLQGRHGQVDLQIEGWTRGFGAERQYQYQVTSDNMVLDETLYAAMQPGQKRMWDAFRPTGTIATTYRLVRTSPSDRRMYISVELKDVTATFQEFPYPLTGLTGKLHFDRESIIVSNVVSEAGGRRIELNGKVTEHGPAGRIYYISIDADGIPLDATLAEALPTQHRALYKRFDANGAARVHARIFNTGDANSVGPIGFLADVSCDAKSLTLMETPLVLSDVRAAAAVTPQSLSIREFAGSFGRSDVTATGAMRFGEDDKLKQYNVKVTASQLPLDETTLGLLPKSAASQVAAFRPQGHVNVTVEVKADSNEPPDYAVVADCLGGRISHERFPYPLHDVRGTVAWTNGSVALKNVTARPLDDSVSQPGPVVRIDGSASLIDGAMGEASFTLHGDDLPFSETLGESLPKDLAGMYRELSPQGRFDLDVTRLKVAGAGEGGTLVEFAGKAVMDACRFKAGGAEVDLCGTLDMEASYKAGRGISGGRTRLAAERITIRNKTITDANVVAVYNPGTKKWLANDFLGNCYGGKLLGTLEIGKAAGAWEYLLRVAFNRVDLQQFLMAGKADASPERYSTSGVMNATLSLGARFGGGNLRRGACQVDIANMRVGKASPFNNLLSVLRLSEPTDYVFDRMQIDSYLKHDELLIRMLDLSGRNVAFTGSGNMDLSSEEVNLTLTARGQRVAAAEPSILQSLTEGLGGAVVRMEVTGKVNNPRIQTKALPVIEDSLKVLGAPE